MNVKKGVWITPTPNTAADCAELVAHLAGAGFDLVIPMAKLTDGSCFYRSEIGPVREAFRAFDPLRAVCEEAGKRGLSVQPRVCVFPDGERSPVVAREPSVRCLDPEGKAVPASEADRDGVWLCPRREEVQDYALSLFEEIMEKYPVDGVHMDFIRYANRRTCFCATCRKSYSERFDSDSLNIGKERENPDYVAALEWRAEPVTRFVRRLSEAVRGRGLALSSTAFPAWPNPLTSQGQDWPGWCAEGLVDFLFPMTYTASARLMRDYTRTHRLLVDERARLWEGVFRHKWMTTDEFAALARSAAEGGAEGVVFFRYDYLQEEDWTSLAGL